MRAGAPPRFGASTGERVRGPGRRRPADGGFHVGSCESRLGGELLEVDAQDGRAIAARLGNHEWMDTAVSDKIAAIEAGVAGDLTLASTLLFQLWVGHMLIKLRDV